MTRTTAGSPLVGKPAPLFALPDPVTGASVALDTYAVGRDVLLLFLRGTWCPFCIQQLRTMTENYERLTAVNIAPLAVICQSQWSVRAHLQRNPLPFPLLCDGSRATAKAYGTHYWLSHEGFNLSHPAIFIRDKSGTITFAHVGSSMSNLPVSAILEKFLAFIPASETATNTVTANGGEK